MTWHGRSRQGDWPARKAALYVALLIILAVIFTATTFAWIPAQESGDSGSSYIRINTYCEDGKVRLREGDTWKLSYSCSEDLREKEAVWTSSDSSIVSVKNGTLTAKRTGNVIITVRIGNNRSDCNVRVQR